MTTIYRTQANRITIAEVKRLILENIPPERYGAIYAQITTDGEIDYEGPVNVIEEVGVMAESFIDRDFPSICAVLNITPVMRIRPAITGFPDTETMDGEYNISHDEFVRFAERYSLLVVVSKAPEPQTTTASDAPAKPAALAWSLKTSIQRAPGYRWPLYQTLKAAHIAGLPCPKARDVLDTWTLKPPPDLQVMPDGVKYNDQLGNPKEADLKAIGQAIKYLLNPSAG